MFDYDHMEREERPFARRLALWITNRLPGSVLDVGAGSGVYVDELRQQGVQALGIDIADPQPRPHCVRTQDLRQCELTAPVVMCIEVAEHLPEDQAQAVISSVWRMTQPGGHVIWSAAQPGQGGSGHINCQPPEYWQHLAQAQGFQSRPDLERDLHAWITAGYHMGWFARNRQIWQRPEA